MPVRIAIYARVSAEDKGQDPENQLRQLRQWCADAGHTIAHEYIDRESGRKGAKGRKQFAQLFEDAHRRKFDCVLFGRWIASPARLGHGPDHVRRS
jgi:DNA invertase Pin-like site-specific DNA recombinase